MFSVRQIISFHVTWRQLISLNSVRVVYTACSTTSELTSGQQEVAHK